MEYTVVSGESSHKLSEAVSDLMYYGWVPLGGVSVAVSRKHEFEAEWVYAQAMTRTPEQARVAAALRNC